MDKTKEDPWNSADFELSELDRDALCEVVNISVGRSADSLSRMVDTEVLLSIPNVEVLAVEAARTEMRNRAGGDDMVMIKQSFDGELNGDSLLLFPETNSLELVRLILQEDLPLEMLAELEQDVLRELGNVLLNSFMATLADTLDFTVGTGLPNYERTRDGQTSKIFMGDDEVSRVLVMRVDFKIDTRDVHGYLGLLVGVADVEKLISCVHKFMGL